ncbi:MAG: DUF433 domain-containing protein [Geobacteraceae bacterium]|nr:DUF433 domain-containing protein [Geobacteraceae bacterium]
MPSLPEDTLNWKDYIIADPEILVGKPVIKGTRLSVDFIIRLLAQGWTEQQIFENYPQLTPDALQAMFAFVQECLADEEFIMTRKVA